MKKHQTIIQLENWKTDAVTGLSDGVRMTAFLLITLSFLKVDFSYFYQSMPVYALTMAAIIGFGAWSTIRKEKNMEVAARRKKRGITAGNDGVTNRNTVAGFGG